MEMVCTKSLPGNFGRQRIFLSKGGLRAVYVRYSSGKGKPVGGVELL